MLQAPRTAPQPVEATRENFIHQLRIQQRDLHQKQEREIGDMDINYLEIGQMDINYLRILVYLVIYDSG